MRGKIMSKEAYQVTMAEIEKLMKIGEKNLSPSSIKRLKTLSKAAEAYEDRHEQMPVSTSLRDILSVKFSQMGINQAYAAQLLGVSETKLSQILNGRQKPDVKLLKAIHVRLKVDGNTLMEIV
jgi:HTH-type transcriptional regulator/antitoxin HigA